MTLLQLATDILTKKTALLNATMLANPYVLAATAIGALVSAYAIFGRRTDEVSEANKKLQESFVNTEAEMKAEQANIDDLFGKLRNAKEGTNEYKTVKEQIINQYGKYLSGLDNEIVTLKNVEGAYKAVAKAAREAALARGKEAALSEVQKNYGTKFSNNMSKLQTALKSVADDKTVGRYLGLVQKELRETGTVSADTGRKIYNLFNGKGINVYRPKVLQFIEGLKSNEKELKDYSALVEQRFQIEDDASKKQEKQNVRNKKAIEDDKKNAQAELEALSVKEAAGKKGAELRKKIAGYNKELESYSASSDKKAATEAAKQWKETVKSNAATIQEERRYQEELDKYTLQAEQARSDARIAAIRNDAERERAEQDEQHRRSLQQIAEQADEMRKAIYEHNKKAWEAEHKDSPYELTEEGEKGWKEISLSDDQQSIINARLEKENAEYSRLLEERRRSERQSMYDYIKEYGSIQQQRLAITKEYDEKISETKDATQKAVLEQKKRQDPRNDSL